MILDIIERRVKWKRGGGGGHRGKENGYGPWDGECGSNLGRKGEGPGREWIKSTVEDWRGTTERREDRGGGGGDEPGTGGGKAEGPGGERDWIWTGRDEQKWTVVCGGWRQAENGSGWRQARRKQFFIGRVFMKLFGAIT